MVADARDQATIEQIKLIATALNNVSVLLISLGILTPWLSSASADHVDVVTSFLLAIASHLFGHYVLGMLR